MLKFDSIRPYRDHEVPDVIDRLLKSDELIQAIIHVQFPKVPQYLEAPLSKLVRYRIRSALKGVKTIYDFQQCMLDFVDYTIKKTITEFTFGGLDNLDPEKPNIFISNHRDITLDSTLLNFVLLRSGQQSAEIAIGDNLLTNPLVSDLLRLNKSFVVSRSVSGMKAKWMALTELSHYIQHANDGGRSVWIAQQEGRAKDGFDLTDPAIIKMLHIWPKKQGLGFAEAFERMNIVPVSISYEYDPCDGLKAAELHAVTENTTYEKQVGEDVESIMRGIALAKGRVHIEVGSPLRGHYSKPQELASAIDDQIVDNYKVFPPSVLALEKMMDEKKPAWHVNKPMDVVRSILSEQKTHWVTSDPKDYDTQAEAFFSRIAKYPESIRPYLLAMYANPLLNKYKISMES